MGKDLIIIKRKLNIKNIAIVTICVASLIAMTTIIMFNIKKANIKKSIEKTALEMSKLQEEKIQERKEKEEKENAKYLPLNNEEILNIEKIYNHSDIKRVFLTFDDGPTNQVTPYILDLLKEEDIKANFFVLGLRVEKNPNIVKREYDEGHFIGNHGYSHKYSTLYQSIDTVKDEYNKTNELIKNAIGNRNYNSLVFRFPGGSIGGYYSDFKKQAVDMLRKNGIASIDWNALTNDADGANTKEKIMENFYNTIKNKTSIVLLMHDAADKILTYETLPEIISYLRNEGYEFQTINQVIGR